MIPFVPYWLVTFAAGVILTLNIISYKENILRLVHSFGGGKFLKFIPRPRGRKTTNEEEVISYWDDVDNLLGGVNLALAVSRHPKTVRNKETGVFREIMHPSRDHWSNRKREHA